MELKEKWLTPSQASQQLGIAEQTLQNFRCQGRGPVYSKIGRVIRYNVVDLDTWLAEHRQDRGAA